MEKRVPHCPLGRVRTLVAAGRVRTTLSALQDAAALGMTFDEMLDVVRALEPKDFFKSMTTYHDTRIWQDVYKPTGAPGRLYVKLTVIEDVLIVSFKEA